MVTTKSQDHVTPLQACQLSILRLSAKFSFAQRYSFSDPEQDPYWFTVYVISIVFTPDFGLMCKIIAPSRTGISIVQNQQVLVAWEYYIIFKWPKFMAGYGS